MINGSVKIPDTWKDFKIVETVSGSFTGQVRISDPEECERFKDEQRLLLRDYTKEQIEMALAITIIPYNSDTKISGEWHD